MPIQPIIRDEHGTQRFRCNMIVSDLLDFATTRGMGLNEIATNGYPHEDYVQFYQLIGYSLGGYSELSDVTDADCESARLCADGGIDTRDAIIASLKAQINDARNGMADGLARLYECHPDDFTSGDEDDLPWN